MEVILDKRYPVAASVAQAWAVLCDIRATAACMPGAQITEQLDDTHYKGTVKSKIGPASMLFNGDIELQGLDAGTRELRMLGKGADRGGSSASMQLTARIEPGESDGDCVLAGVATVVVSGKLAQFGNRLLVPVSDAMLAQFADNFRAAAQAVPAPAAAAAPANAADAADSTLTLLVEAGQAPGDPAAMAVARVSGAPAPAAAAAPRPAAPVKELNALALLWTVFKNWLAGLFGGKKV